MPPARKTITVQDEFDDCEGLVWSAIADGRIDNDERSAIRRQFALIRGDLSKIDGAVSMCEAILRVGEITPKVERRLREIQRDAANVVAFRDREPNEAA